MACTAEYSPHIREKKLDSFHFFDNRDGTYRVVHKSGLEEILSEGGADKIALPSQMRSAQGHVVTLHYDNEGQGRRLAGINNADGTPLLRLEPAQARDKVFLRLHPGTLYEALFTMQMSNDRWVTRIELPTEEKASWRFDYDLQPAGGLRLKRVETPVGGVETITYAQIPHYIPNVDRDTLARVDTHHNDPGFGQPAIVTHYTYPADHHNFLGYDSGAVWSDDGLDNLYRAKEDYIYSTTQSLWDVNSNTAIRRITRTFNRFHLLRVEETTQNDNVLHNETFYHLQPGTEFEHQPAYCQLPHIASQTWYRKSNPDPKHTETVTTTYDDFGNLLTQVNANGVTETSTWYMAEGEKDEEGNVLCPKDPHDFVRHLKSKTVTPAPSKYGAAPVLQTQYRYAGYQGLEGRGTWLAIRDETLLQVGNDQEPLQVTAYTYIDQPDNPFEHGRKLRDEVTLNGKTTTTGYRYTQERFARTDEAVLRTDSETIGFDDQSVRSVRKRITLLDSLHSGESLRTHDDTNVEIDYEYDVLRRVTKETVAPNSTQYKASRTYTYTLTNAVGQQAMQTACDVKGVTTTTWLDGLNRVIEEARQDADATGFDRNAEPRKIYQARYNNREQLVSETVIDWEGAKDVVLTSTFNYDDWGEQRRMIRPDGIEEYEVTDPINQTTTQWLGVKDEEGKDKQVRGKTVTTNNLFGKPDDIKRYHLGDDVRPYSEHIYHYDGMGRTAEEYDAVHNKTMYEYDAFDRMIKTRLPDYNVVERVYAVHSREDLPIKISVNGVVLGEQRYDGLDRMITSITGGRESVYTFDPGQTQPKSVKRPSGVETAYVYRPELGEDPEQRIALESTANYEYDHENARLRKTEEVDKDCITHNLVREYFSTGELKSERREKRREGEEEPFESFEMHYGYSRQARILSYTDVLGQTQTYTYDASKNARLIATKLGNTESTFAYDEAGELAKIDTRDGAQRLITELEYDDFGREVLRTFHLGNGITQTLSQTYDEVDRLTQRTLTQMVEGEPEETLREEIYSYDERGRLVFYDCSGRQPPVDPYGKAIKSQMFSFDAQDNLDFVETTFDGGRHSIYFEYGNELDPCQLTGLRNDLKPPRPGDPDYPDRIDFPYDDDGNLLQDEVGHFLSYDSLGRLISVSVGSGGTANEYDYDSLDTLSGGSNGGTHERRFYQGDQLANRIQGSDSSTYVRANRVVLAEHQAGADPKSLLLAGDDKNSVLCEVSQHQRQESAYSPYGHRANDAAASSHLGYNGELREEQTGWYLLGNGYRAYNSEVMRFQSSDSLSPFGRGGRNAYMYCGGEPINFLDRTGGYRFFHWLAKRLGLSSKTAANKAPKRATAPTVKSSGRAEKPNAGLVNEEAATFKGYEKGGRASDKPLSPAQIEYTERLISRGEPFDLKNEFNVLGFRTNAIEELPMTPPTPRRIGAAPTSSRTAVVDTATVIRTTEKKPSVMSKAMQRRNQ